VAAEEAVDVMHARGLTTCALSAPLALAQLLAATQGAAAGERIEAVLVRAEEVAHASGACSGRSTDATSMARRSCSVLSMAGTSWSRAARAVMQSRSQTA
jgi:hypothetical protein